MFRAHQQPLENRPVRLEGLQQNLPKARSHSYGRSLPARARLFSNQATDFCRPKSKLGLAECVLKNNVVASESKKVASSGRYRLPARIRRNKVPLKPPYVAGNHYLEIFKSPVRKAFKKSFDALSDFFLAEVSLPEAIWSTEAW